MPLGFGEAPGGAVGLLLGDGDHLVVDGGVQGLGHEAGADALEAVGAALALGEHRGARGLHGHHLDGGVPLL